MIDVRDLSFKAGQQAVLSRINFTIAQGETLALIGPSGSGKTSLAMLLLGLQAGAHRKSQQTRRGEHWSGAALVAGIDMLRASTAARRRVLGAQIGLIVQGISDALNPQLTVRNHINEVLHRHRLHEITVEDICARYNIPVRLLDQFPVALSGGETQRVLAALALLPRPKALVLDEPNASLDAENRERALKIFSNGAEERAQLLISHDLELIAKMSDRIAVLVAGEIVETGPTAQVLTHPQNKYAQMFLGKQTGPKRRTARPPRTVAPLLHIANLGYAYGARQILANLDFRIGTNEFVAITGESGGGKSTLARLIAGFLPIQKGSFVWTEKEPTNSRIGFVSQTPHQAIAPHFSVYQTLHEAFTLMRLPIDAQSIPELLHKVGLPNTSQFLLRQTRNLSGGEAQRLSIARALIGDPQLIVADEPTSALDPISKAKVFETLHQIQGRGVSIVMFTHNKSDALQHADRILQLNSGTIGPYVNELVILRHAEMAT